MTYPVDHRQIGGGTFRVSDCYIWAEINYLDSPTNYREYLPQSCRESRRPADEEWVMLDRPLVSQNSLVESLIPLFLFIVSGVFLLVLLKSF
jgi:hypothetical protein